MVNPQKENGHVGIANEIWDALVKLRIPGEARQVLDAILRKTYGWNKKEDIISLKQFEKMTGIKRPNIIRARGKLLEMGIISVIQKDNSYDVSYRFIKDYEQWKPLSKKITLSKKIIPVIQKDNRPLSKKITPILRKKETKTKEKPTKENQRSQTFSETDKSLVQLLIDMMLENEPNSHTISCLTEKRQIEWINSCRLMREKDKRTPEQIKALIEFSQNDKFWKANILSFPKLREKQDMLILRYKQNHPSQSGIAKWYHKMEEKHGKHEGL